MHFTTKIGLALIALGILLLVVGFASHTPALTQLAPLAIALGVIALAVRLVSRLIGKGRRGRGML